MNGNRALEYDYDRVVLSKKTHDDGWTDVKLLSPAYDQHKNLPKPMSIKSKPEPRIIVIILIDEFHADHSWQEQRKIMQDILKKQELPKQELPWRLESNSDTKYTLKHKNFANKNITVRRDANKITISACAEQVAGDAQMMQLLLGQAVQKAIAVKTTDIKVTGASAALLQRLNIMLQVICKNTDKGKFTLIYGNHNNYQMR
ncbi:MAG: hypothetical protein COC15_02500 [Legionellales bacterium]|nr:MAG: hypothetical protein COC15_02500 [Legionellales bacterium]